MRFWKAGSIASMVAALGAAAFIVPHEGVETDPYLDPVGIPTDCAGNTQGVVMGQSRTQEECMQLLLEDTEDAQRCVIKNVEVPMSEGQLKAFTSFVFNVGCGRFKRSSLLRELNAGNYEAACNWLPRWVYGTKNGVKEKLPGLVKRREAEKALCLGL